MSGFAEMIDAVLAGEAWTLYRAGRPVAVIVPWDDYERIQAALADRPKREANE